MIGWLAGLLGGGKKARPIAWAVVVLVVALLAWGGLSLLVDNHDRVVVERADAARQIQVERGARAADAAAEGRRDERREARVTQQEEFDHATDHLPAEGLTRRQRLDLCRELRDAGHDVDQLAECGDVRPGA